MGWQGSKIKNRAKEQKLTILELAKVLDVSRQTISSWIQGQIPRGQHLVKLCQILKTTPDYFFSSEINKLVSMPMHRTVRKKRVTDVMEKESLYMAEQYLNLFKKAPSARITPVLKVNQRNKENAKIIAKELREFSEIKSDKPMDLEHSFKMIEKLGIYTVFRSFPDSTKKHIYAFFSEICDQSVIFINIHTNIIDLIFQLLHETVHAIRNKENALIDYNEEEESFCDDVANYIQFPDEYVDFVAKSIADLEPAIQVKKLKQFSEQYKHSLFGIIIRLKDLGVCNELNIGGADTNLKKKFPTVEEMIFEQNDPRDYINCLKELSPNLIKLLKEHIDNCSLRKFGEWLGIDNSLDAKTLMNELKRC